MYAADYHSLPPTTERVFVGTTKVLRRYNNWQYEHVYETRVVNNNDVEC